MTVLQVQQLHAGDQVYWNDPDDGLCSRLLAILEIKYTGDEAFIITDESGDEIGAFACELS